MVLFLSVLGLIVISEHVLYLVLMSFLLALNVYLPARVVQRRTMCLIPFKNVLLQQSAYYLKVVFTTFLLLCFFATLVTLGKMFFISLQKLFPLFPFYRTLDNQVSWCHQMPEHKNRNTFY